MRPKLLRSVESSDFAFYRIGGVVRRWPILNNELVLPQVVECGEHLYPVYFRNTACVEQNILILPKGIYWNGNKLYSLIRTPFGWKKHVFKLGLHEIDTLLLGIVEERPLFYTLQRHVKLNRARLHGLSSDPSDPVHMENGFLLPSETRATLGLRLQNGPHLRVYYRRSDGSYDFAVTDNPFVVPEEQRMQTSVCCLHDSYIEVVLSIKEDFVCTFLVSRQDEELVRAHYWSKERDEILDEHDIPLAKHLFDCSSASLVFLDNNNRNFQRSNVRRKVENIFYYHKKHRLRARKNTRYKYFTIQNHEEYDPVLEQALNFVNNL